MEPCKTDLNGSAFVLLQSHGDSALKLLHQHVASKTILTKALQCEKCTFWKGAMDFVKGEKRKTTAYNHCHCESMCCVIVQQAHCLRLVTTCFVWIWILVYVFCC